MTASSASGLLIVNADDLGLGIWETDSILEAYRAGGVTSTTAMVWMADSDRAAERASAAGIPVGLHLNLVEPFTASDVPESVAAAQRRIIARLSSGPGAYAPHLGWSQDFSACIDAQVRRFVEIYGRPPTHFDGHRHLHLVPNALLTGTLRSIGRYRRPLSRTEAESSPARQRARDLWFQLFRTLYLSTRWCFSIRAMAPELGGSGIEPFLSCARCDTVEVMVHPGWSDEQAVLVDARWCSLIRDHRLGSYADLLDRAG